MELFLHRIKIEKGKDKKEKMGNAILAQAPARPIPPFLFSRAQPAQLGPSLFPPPTSRARRPSSVLPPRWLSGDAVAEGPPVSRRSPTPSSSRFPPRRLLLKPGARSPAPSPAAVPSAVSQRPVMGPALHNAAPTPRQRMPRPSRQPPRELLLPHGRSPSQNRQGQWRPNRAKVCPLRAILLPGLRRAHASPKSRWIPHRLGRPHPHRPLKTTHGSPSAAIRRRPPREP